LQLKKQWGDSLEQQMGFRGEKMKSLSKVCAVAALAGSAMTTASVVNAEMSYNVGYASVLLPRYLAEKLVG